MSFSAITVDLVNRRVLRNDEDLHLTPIEFRLLAELLANAGKVITQRQLLSHVWGRTTWSTATICASTWATCGRSSKPIRPGPNTC